MWFAYTIDYFQLYQYIEMIGEKTYLQLSSSATTAHKLREVYLAGRFKGKKL